MTKQEMFDKAVEGLASQNWVRCSDPKGGCVYRRSTENGEMRCAYGWTMDSDLLKRIESHGLIMAPHYSILDAYPDAPRPEDMPAANHYQFIRDLQTCHDAFQVPTQTKEALKLFAKKYDLKPSKFLE